MNKITQYGWWVLIGIALLAGLFSYFYLSSSSKETLIESFQEAKRATMSLAVEGDYKPTFDYLEANGCNYDMSNFDYTICAKEAMEKIKLEKQKRYAKFQEFLKKTLLNALGEDEELWVGFENWYKDSERNNHSRCLADNYWTGAGSAYNQNIYICEIFETQRDIELLEKLYEKRDYFEG